MDHIKQENINIGSKIYHFVTDRTVYHIVFWLVFFSFLFFLEWFPIRDKAPDLLSIISNQLIIIAFYAIIVYFNYGYLIPKYFKWNKVYYYILFLALFILLISPLRTMIFYLKFYDSPLDREILLGEQYNTYIANFLVGGFSTIFKIVSDWARHQREKTVLEAKNLQSELNFLRSQINPHFLFNTLNNLYALTLKKSDKAPEIVIKLSDMMRYMLYECNEKEVPLIKEVNYLRNYLDLEKLRQAKNIDIQLKVNGMVTNQRIAPLMFIPFIENSFKHGLNNQISEGFVHIVLDVDKDKVHLNVNNSKSPTLPVRQGKRSGGIGLVNVKRRLSLLYPHGHSLEIEDNPNNYEVDLTIELE